MYICLYENYMKQDYASKGLTNRTLERQSTVSMLSVCINAACEVKTLACVSSFLRIHTQDNVSHFPVTLWRN